MQITNTGNEREDIIAKLTEIKSIIRQYLYCMTTSQSMQVKFFKSRKTQITEIDLERLENLIYIISKI